MNHQQHLLQRFHIVQLLFQQNLNQQDSLGGILQSQQHFLQKQLDKTINIAIMKYLFFILDTP